jgi:uncharacterized protein with PIN domain
MVEPSAKAPPLLLDAMLGKLARRLRWLGYDAEYRNDLSDGELMALALREGRVLITRDRGLANRRAWREDGRRLYLAETELEAQVRAIMAALGPPPGPGRCIVCNGDLDPLSPAEAAPLVPPYVAQTQTEFVRCRRCRRVYWPGTHLAGLEAWRP